MLCVLTRWDFNFCVRSSPLRGHKKRVKGVGKLGWFMSRTQTFTSPPREGEPAGTKKKKEKKKRTNWNHNIWYVYADGSITSDQAGWYSTVEQGTTNIHESSAAYKVKTYTHSHIHIVMDTLHWITSRCSRQTSASVLSHSVKVKMENSKKACNNVWPQSLKSAVNHYYILFWSFPIWLLLNVIELRH